MKATPDTPANLRQCWRNLYKQVSSGPEDSGVRLGEEGLEMAACPRLWIKNVEAPMCVGCMSVGFGWRCKNNHCVYMAIR